MTSNDVRIGSRGSDLALWQARWVQKELTRRFPARTVTIDIIKTTGDVIQDSPLSRIGDKGLFTKEIEEALLDRRIDIAVHSLKDLPTLLPAGLAIGAVCAREDVRDVFIPHPRNSHRTLLDQRTGAQIATGSLRRRCQLLAVRPDFQVVDLRGNLNTRMKKLENSAWAGMILARAGVVRLGWEKAIGEEIPMELMLPAVGQGALGIEIRKGDDPIAGIVATLNHADTACATTAERALLRRLEGGCQVPIGTHGRLESSADVTRILVLDAMVGSLDGRSVLRGRAEGDPAGAESLGTDLAVNLLARGADEILGDIRRDSGSHESA
jgi:hydroxymethylbilane synthase